MGADASGGSEKAKPSIKHMRELAASTVREQFRVVTEAAHGCDLIVAATGIQIATRSIAEKLGIPYIFAGYCPEVFPALDHPPPPPPKAGSTWHLGYPATRYRASTREPHRTCRARLARQPATLEDVSWEDASPWEAIIDRGRAAEARHRA